MDGERAIEAAGPPPAPSEPGRDAPAGEPARSQRISILEGCLAQVHITITGGALLTAYALMLGANEFHLGLLSALVALSTVGGVVGAQWVGHIGRRKPLSVVSSAGGRVLWAVLCFLPFLHASARLKMTLFLMIVLVGSGMVNLSGTGWLSWMTDLVPIERRGRYFGLRNTIVGTVGMAVTIGSGLAFDSFVARGQRAIGLTVIFGTAAFCAALAGAVLTRQWEPSLRGEGPRPLTETMRVPFADRRFRRLLAFLILWAMATGLAGPFFAAHMIQNLKMSFSRIALYSIVAGVLILFTQPLWGRIIDRVGNRPVLGMNLLGVFFLPLLWLFATPTRLFPIWLDAALTGLFWPGFTLASFNLVLALAPEENRTSFLGVQGTAVGLATFLASLAGGLIASALSGFRLSVAGLHLVNYHVLFALSSVFRISLLPLALGLREEGAQTVGALFGLVGDKVSQSIYQGWQTRGAAIRRIGRP